MAERAGGAAAVPVDQSGGAAWPVPVRIKGAVRRRLRAWRRCRDGALSDVGHVVQPEPLRGVTARFLVLIVVGCGSVHETGRAIFLAAFVDRRREWCRFGATSFVGLFLERCKRVSSRIRSVSRVLFDRHRNLVGVDIEHIAMLQGMGLGA